MFQQFKEKKCSSVRCNTHTNMQLWVMTKTHEYVVRYFSERTLKEPPIQCWLIRKAIDWFRVQILATICITLHIYWWQLFLHFLHIYSAPACHTELFDCLLSAACLHALQVVDLGNNDKYSIQRKYTFYRVIVFVVL